MRNAPIQQVLPNTGSQNFKALPTMQIFAASLQAINGDSASAGTIKLQGSNDFSPAGTIGQFVPTNWSDIPSATATVVAGATVLIPKTDICYQWIRGVWTSSNAGTTTITLEWNLQGI